MAELEYQGRVPSCLQLSRQPMPLHHRWRRSDRGRVLRHGCALDR
jgi:hypothetical protein